ncbi:MAG TPA: DinB family protein [Actinomycetota bacterium]|nr:DinB family protein [Actinomycetota bacterium]
MSKDGVNSVLTTLAAHNEWANQLIFAACSEVSTTDLKEAAGGYDSIVGILEHLVQVEHSFFELAHGRQPRKIRTEELEELRGECAEIDRAYVDYVADLDLARAATERFLVPWFGFEITLAEGILQPLTHSHKHRADISMLLPTLGGVGIEMDLIQWIDETRPM